MGALEARLKQLSAANEKLRNELTISRAHTAEMQFAGSRAEGTQLRDSLEIQRLPNTELDSSTQASDSYPPGLFTVAHPIEHSGLAITEYSKDEMTMMSDELDAAHKDIADLVEERASFLNLLMQLRKELESINGQMAARE